MADDKVFTGKDGALWVQAAPARAPAYLGCYDLDDVSADQGGIELIQCFDVNGAYKTLGAIEEAPSPITTTLTTFLGKTAEFLEGLRCPFILHVNMRCGGRADIFGNYERAFVFEVQRITNRTLKGLVVRKDPASAEQSFDISILPPFIDIYNLTPRRQGITETRAANDIFFLDSEQCPSDCVVSHNLGDLGIIGTDGAGGVTANVHLTEDGGVTWVVAAADPFAVAQNISAVSGIFVGRDTIRWLVARGTTDAGNPAELAYTDDDGATWTNVDVGTTNAQFTPSKKGIYAADEFNIWVVTSGGYIYKSENGAVSFSEQHAGTLTVQNLNVIMFEKGSRKVGWAGGASNTLLSTADGETWSLVTGPAAEAGNAVQSISVLDSNRVWITYGSGRQYLTEDAGLTWTEFAFTGSGSGSVKDIFFLNSLVGFMIHDTGGPVGTVFFTRNGGFTWEALVTPTNAGLNAVYALKSNLAYVAGEVQGTTPMILKVT